MIGGFPSQRASNAVCFPSHAFSIYGIYCICLFISAIQKTKTHFFNFNIENLTLNLRLNSISHEKMIFDYDDVTMSGMASQITILRIVYSPVYPGADQRKHQSPASLAFVRGIHRGLVNSPHKWPVTRKLFPLDDVIMRSEKQSPEDRDKPASTYLHVLALSGQSLWQTNHKMVFQWVPVLLCDLWHHIMDKI